MGNRRIITFTALPDEEEKIDANSNNTDFPTYEEIYQWYMENTKERWKNLSKETKHKCADGDAKGILAFSSPLRETFLHWWRTGELIDDLEIAGYTIGYILRERNQWLPNAFFVFEDLMNDPEDSTARMYLEHGLSKIVF